MLYLRGTELGKRDTVYKDFSSKKSFLNKTLPKPLGYMISTRETMFSLKTFFLNRDIDMMINHDESFICHVMGSEPLFMAYPFHDISILHC